MTNVATQAVRPQDEGGFLALMRHRNYALLWRGQLISALGDRIHWVAISLWVYAVTGSALSVSYAIMALVIAPALVGLYAGVLVDRLDRRKIMIAADLARAALVSAIPWLMTQGLVWVYIDLFLMSAASAFFRPAMFATIPQSVPTHRLLQANAFFASMDSSTEVIGPAIAGILIAKIDYAAAMYVDAGSFMLSALFVSALRLRGTYQRGDSHQRTPQLARQTTGALRSIGEGFRYIRSDPIQVALLAFLFAGQWVVGLSSLQTPLAKGVIGITDYQFGWFQSIWGLGFVGSSLAVGWYGGQVPRGQMMIGGYILWALASLTMGLSGNYGMLVVAGFWVGFANTIVFINVATVMMEHTPSDKIGRAIATRQVCLAVVRLTALLGFGWLGDLTSVRTAIVAMSAVSLTGTLMAIARYPALSRYRSSPLSDSSVASIVSKMTAGFDFFRRRFIRFLESRSDKAFSLSEQRWLNGATLLVVVSGWLLLFLSLPAQALGVAASVSAIIGFWILLRRVRHRLGRHPGSQSR